MKSDKSRETFDPDKHYSSVRLQQGRVLTDADWNEQSDIVQHRNEVTSRDVIGPSGVPLVDPQGDGFLVQADTVNNDLLVFPGRIYVDGILCELNEMLRYSSQADLINPPPINPQASGVIVAYLDVWQRHIDSIEDGNIREVALGGPDTATRAQTVRQVKFLPIASDTLISDVDSRPEWQELIAPSSGALSARAEPTTAAFDPCIIPQSAGFRRLENQLYRVEIHTPGFIGGGSGSGSGSSSGEPLPLFKWSRDNGSVTASITAADPGSHTLTINLLTTDETRGFAIDQWIEVIDDERDLKSQPGAFVKLLQADGNLLTYNASTIQDPLGQFTPTTGITIGTLHNPRVRRWDMLDGPIAANRDTSVNNGWIDLEDGVQVLFENGSYQTGDYWQIPARTLFNQVEWPGAPDFPQARAPFGIKHHFTCLAQFVLPRYLPSADCRQRFLPLTALGTLTPIDIPKPDEFRYYLVDADNGSDQSGRPGVDADPDRALSLAQRYQSIPRMNRDFPRDGNGSVAIVLFAPRADGTPYPEWNLLGVHGYKKILIRGSNLDQDVNTPLELILSGSVTPSGLNNGVVTSQQVTDDHLLQFSSNTFQDDPQQVGKRLRFDPDAAGVANVTSMVLENSTSTLTLANHLNQFPVQNTRVFLESPGVSISALRFGVSSTRTLAALDGQLDRPGFSLVGLNVTNLSFNGGVTAEMAFCNVSRMTLDSFGVFNISDNFTDEKGVVIQVGLGASLGELHATNGTSLQVQNSKIFTCDVVAVDNFTVPSGYYGQKSTIRQCNRFTIGTSRTNNSAPRLVRLGQNTPDRAVELSDSSGAILSSLFENPNPIVPGFDFQTTAASIAFSGVNRALRIEDIDYKFGSSGQPSGVILDALGAVASTIDYDPKGVTVSGLVTIPGHTFFRPFELFQTDVIDQAGNHYFIPGKTFVSKGPSFAAQSTEGTDAIPRYSVTEFTGNGTAVRLARRDSRTSAQIVQALAGVAQQEITEIQTGSSFTAHVAEGYTLVALAASTGTALPAPVYLSGFDGKVTTDRPTGSTPIVQIGSLIQIIGELHDGIPGGGDSMGLVRLKFEAIPPPPPTTPPIIP